MNPNPGHPLPYSVRRAREELPGSKPPRQAHHIWTLLHSLAGESLIELSDFSGVAATSSSVFPDVIPQPVVIASTIVWGACMQGPRPTTGEARSPGQDCEVSPLKLKEGKEEKKMRDPVHRTKISLCFSPSSSMDGVV
jgi:hypothetical protein